jgi:hypothetical protein
MDQHPDIWTAEGVKGGLIRFYREIAGVGLVFPRADRPIAVEFPGYPVVRLRPIEGLEFVEETVTALGSSTELAHHLFRECWAIGTGSYIDLVRLGGGGAQVQGRDGGRPGGALAVGRLHQSCLRECSPPRCRWSVRNSFHVLSL